MSIKTLLFAGEATFGLCAGAQAQTVQFNVLGQNITAANTAAQVQTLTQGNALVNAATQVQVVNQINVSPNVGLQNNIATPTNVYVPVRIGK